MQQLLPKDLIVKKKKKGRDLSIDRGEKSKKEFYDNFLVTTGRVSCSLFDHTEGGYAFDLLGHIISRRIRLTM